MNSRTLLLLAALAVSAAITPAASNPLGGPGLSGPCAGGVPGAGFDVNPVDQRKCVYDWVLSAFRIGPGQARTLAGKQNEPWVRYVIAYENHSLLNGVGSELTAAEEAMRRSYQAAQASAAAAQSTPKLRDLAPSTGELQQMREILDKLAARLAVVRSELEAQESILLATFDAAKTAAADADEAARPPYDLAGDWGAMGFIYSFTQKGNTFEWKNKDLDEVGKGTITGLKVKASWKGKWGAAEGTADIVVNGNGRAVRLDWNNGIKFVRK
ncbi:MAG: hypothetical protein JO055_14635 [Alphaproteobacteria bacterium]|nr:hypothetical protein [Alphaproteobacteria bacterium]